MAFYHESEEEEDFPSSSPSSTSQTGQPNRPANKNVPQPEKQNPGNMSGKNPQTESTKLFKQPGGLKDLKDESWSQTVSSVIEPYIGKEDVRFYNPITQPADDTGPTPYEWRAFPNSLQNQKNKWKLADIREKQDEYCEWEVVRDINGKITKITFTCEVPEYWRQLCDENPALLVEQYQKLTGVNAITLDDLKEGGSYNTKNKWNYESGQGHIIHLTQPNNTLKDAVDLIADSAILKFDDNKKLITDKMKLLELVPSIQDVEKSKQRSSDPIIMDAVNRLVRKGNSVAITESPGLYIQPLDSTKFSAPDDDVDITSFWKVIRGEDGNCVRAEFEVPQEHDFVVGDIMDDKNNPIEYGSQVARHVWVRLDLNSKLHADVTSDSTSNAGQRSPSIYQYIEGRDIEPFPLDSSFIANNLDKEWFGRYLTKTSPRATALKFSELVAQLPNNTWRAYAADEGIGIEFSEPRKNERVRLVIFCTPEHSTGVPKGRSTSRVADIDKLVKNSFTVDTLAIVAVPPENDPTNIDSPKSFLQVASYSKALGVFHFYDRERLSQPGAQPRWLYFGSSMDAFAGDTHGLGVFCGHPNGGIVMKEPDEPWLHWHTDKHQLEIPNDHPLHRYKDLKDGRDWNFGMGRDMASMVLRGTKAWFDKRLKLDLGSEVLAKPPKPNPIAKGVNQWIAHILLSTSVNIRVSNSEDDRIIKVPEGFFFNRDALRLCIDLSKLGDDLEVDAIPQATYDIARKKLGLVTVYEFGKEPGDRDKAVGATEAQAPWKVLVPSREDVEGVDRVIKSKLLSKKEVAALLMVDFWNPIYSWRRAQLMRYIPSTARWDGSKYTLGPGMTNAIRTAASFKDNDSPEAEYIKLVDMPGDFSANFSRKLTEFIKQVNKNLGDRGRAAAWVERYLKVAESKRRIFRPPPSSNRPSHPLAEFSMALPYAIKLSDDTNDQPWEMTERGDVAQVQPSEKIWHPRNAQAHFSSSGCPFSASD